MEDRDFNAKIIRRVNLLSAKNRYSFTLGSTPMVTCTQHGDYTSYRITLPGFTIPRDVCPVCFMDAFPDIKEPVKDPAVELEEDEVKPILPPDEDYSCEHTDVTGKSCDVPTDYHNQCTFCRNFYCKDHLDKDYCCAECLQQLEGGFTHESLRGS